MRCEIVSYHVSTGANSQSEAAHHCVTHDWTILIPVEEGHQCPIGRIEQARDSALLAIAERADAIELLNWARGQHGLKPSEK